MFDCSHHREDTPMAERGWARLTIRGRVTRRALLRALTAGGYTEIDLDGALAGRGDACEGLALSGDGLQITDEQAAYGVFPDLEAALVRAGIAFDRESGAVGEFGESVAQFRPGMARPYEALVDGQEPLVRVSAVRAELAKGAKALRAWLDIEHASIPPLTPFTLIASQRRRHGASRAGRHPR
jgi:hypothetical protein